MEVLGKKVKRGQGNKGVFRELEENIGVWWRAKKKSSVFLVSFSKQTGVPEKQREVWIRDFPGIIVVYQSSSPNKTRLEDKQIKSSVSTFHLYQQRATTAKECE